jgi:hypothetical protein
VENLSTVYVDKSDPYPPCPAFAHHLFTGSLRVWKTYPHCMWIKGKAREKLKIFS